MHMRKEGIYIVLFMGHSKISLSPHALCDIISSDVYKIASLGVRGDNLNHIGHDLNVMERAHDITTTFIHFRIQQTQSWRHCNYNQFLG